LDCVLFFDQELISYCYSSSVFSVVEGHPSSKKPKALSFQTGSRWKVAGMFFK